MASASFPVTFPTALELVGTQTLSDVQHADNLHNKDRAEIIATQTKVGLGSSVAGSFTVLLGTGGTQSAWGSIANSHVSGTAAISVSKLAPASANGSILTTEAGTAVWALLTNNNVSGTAAIVVSKLAAGSAGYTLRSTSGTAVWAAPPSVLVYNSGSIAVADSTFTPLTFNSERYDTDSMHGTVNTDRLTCVTPGKYSGFAAAQFASNSTGYRTMAVYHSGLNGYIASAWQPAVNGNVTALMCPFQCSLTAGQYLRVDVFQASGGTLYVQQQDYYSPSAGMIWTGP